MRERNYKKQISLKDIYLEKGTKYCDCGTAFGVGLLNQTKAKRISKEDIEKLEKKGWSSSKIERWKSDKLKSETKRREKNQMISNADYDELERWTAFLNEIFERNKINKFGLLLHWYSGGLNAERIKLKNKHRSKIKDISPAFFKHIEEDVLYEIVK